MLPLLVLSEYPAPVSDSGCGYVLWCARVSVCDVLGTLRCLPHVHMSRLSALWCAWVHVCDVLNTLNCLPRVRMSCLSVLWCAWVSVCDMLSTPHCLPHVRMSCLAVFYLCDPVHCISILTCVCVSLAGFMAVLCLTPPSECLDYSCLLP